MGAATNTARWEKHMDSYQIEITSNKLIEIRNMLSDEASYMNDIWDKAYDRKREIEEIEEGAGSLREHTEYLDEILTKLHEAQDVRDSAASEDILP